jgi:metal-responsive CopG/Arc/MetJ family transcriptional regulator
MPSEKPKIIFVATEELEERIDIYWHEKRLRNRSTAIRQLLKDALDRYEKKKK